MADKQVKDEAILGNDFIRFSNALKPLTEFEMDIFLFMCSKAKENYKNGNGWEKELEINMIDFFEKSGKKTKWQHYTEEEKINFFHQIINLRDKHFSIFRDKYKRIINNKTGWKEYIVFDYLVSPKFDLEKNIISAKMTSQTQEFLCNDDTNFTPIKIKNLFKLKSKTTKLLYIYFRSYIENNDSQIRGLSISIDNLKKYIGLNEKYTRWIDFKKYILVPAVKEINEKTDIFITGYKEAMDKELAGRKIIDLTEKEQLDLIIKSICKKGKIGKTIEKLEIHVLDKNYKIYKDYYENNDQKNE